MAIFSDLPQALSLSDTAEYRLCGCWNWCQTKGSAGSDTWL
jgi:hypothetical protein